MSKHQHHPATWSTQSYAGPTSEENEQHSPHHAGSHHQSFAPADHGFAPAWDDGPRHHSSGDAPSWQRGEDSFGHSSDSFGPQQDSFQPQHGSCHGGTAQPEHPGLADPHSSGLPVHGGEDLHASPAADLGWGDAAWGEAGGFDAVLIGHLLGDMSGGAAGHGPIYIIPIEHLEINNITQIETTQIFLNAANGGSIQIGGAVNAESSQGLLGAPDSLQDGSHGSPLGSLPIGGHDSTATNEVTLIAGNGEGNMIGGNVTAIADQHLPDAHFF